MYCPRSECTTPKHNCTSCTAQAPRSECTTPKHNCTSIVLGVKNSGRCEFTSPSGMLIIRMFVFLDSSRHYVKSLHFHCADVCFVTNPRTSRGFALCGDALDAQRHNAPCGGAVSCIQNHHASRHRKTATRSVNERPGQPTSFGLWRWHTASQPSFKGLLDRPLDACFSQCASYESPSVSYGVVCTFTQVLIHSACRHVAADHGGRSQLSEIIGPN